MTSDGIVVEPMDAAAALAAVEAFTLVYAEVFAEPPYDEDAADVAAAFERFPTQTRRPGFAAALARTGTGEPVGMAFGHALTPETAWWDELTVPVPEAMRREDGERTFALMEFAVREAWRGRGVAQRLHTALLAQVRAERVLLNVHQEAAPAMRAYRSWGYERVGEAKAWGVGDLHDVMILTLRPDGG
ncbi:hypothetical protein GCM10009830_00980 [Glycomyces endophyticus]|uniref:N-acetyltransferase domain-containing protein n=1 Tax=Glycomyces endophyticus TaxID=480996 RepID=A0ABN2FUC6_9ACTN